ncbi:MAG: hypothetical protein NT000_03280 [Proteobacteria bacterium]|nr:hypothetical protein [Pseudomonadota bacterium]NQW44258.1 hypothetical protein [Deltaproteobacteria bacterium]
MYQRIFQWLIVGLVVSCGGKQSDNGLDNPNGYSYDQGPAILAHADLQIGSLQKSFVGQHNVACIADKKLGETVIIFNDANSGATLSVRMGRIDLSANSESRTYNLIANEGHDSFLISVNTDKDNGIFRLEANPSATYVPSCEINYTLDAWQMNAEFRCYSMSNRAGQVQEARGNWTCKIQSEVQWQW